MMTLLRLLMLVLITDYALAIPPPVVPWSGKVNVLFRPSAAFIGRHEEKRIGRQDAGKPEHPSNSKLDAFVAGAKYPFKDYLFFKILCYEGITYFGGRGIGMFASRRLTPQTICTLSAPFFRFHAIGMWSTKWFAVVTLAIQLVAYFAFAFVPAIIWSIVLAKTDQTSNGGSDKDALLIRSGLSLVDACMIAPFFDEVLFRRLLPVVLQHFWAAVRRGKPSKPPVIRPLGTVTICSLLFAMSHIETALLVANGEFLISRVNSYVLSSFLLAQWILVPAYDSKGLFASWGAHTSFNAALLVLRFVTEASIWKNLLLAKQ